MPAFDEAERLERTLPQIVAYARARSISTEIVVVDDGSRDGTAERAAELLRHGAGRVITLPENRGKGAAVRRGLLEARGRWALVTDADLSTPIDQHEKLAATARDHDADVVIGSRDLPDSDVRLRQNPLRETMGRVFGILVRMVTGLRFRDTQCGFKLLDLDRTRSVVERQVIDGFAFDVELLFLCRRYGLQVREVPVVWSDARPSAVSIVRDPVRMFTDLLRIRWRFRRGMYRPAAEAR